MAAREPTPLLYARCGDERGEVFSTVNTALGVGGGGAAGGPLFSPGSRKYEL